MSGLFNVLKAEGLTTLKLRYDFRTDVFRFMAAKEWDEGVDFSQYNKKFNVGSLLTDENVYLNTPQVLAMFEKHGLAEYLEKLKGLVRQGKHFGIDMLYNDKFNIRFICGIHSPKRGVNNKSHATMAGATRRKSHDIPEIDAIIDALNLSRAMAFKNIAADIPFGGCKTTVQIDSPDITNMELMGFLAYACDTTRCLTGPDMAFPKEMVKVMTDNFTMQYCGGPGSALGDTAIPTAYGTYLALKQAVKFQTGSESLDGMSAAVQGMGAVGYATAQYLAREKTKLYIADIDQTRLDRFKEEHPNHDVTIVAPDEILKVEADICCPSAMGGIWGEEEINAAKFKYIIGAANNQLRATSQDEEIRLAKLLAGRGILYQVDWWHNCAGVLAAAMEYTYGYAKNNDDLVKRVEEVVPVQTWKNLTRAKDQGITPTESAYLSCNELIYGDVTSRFWAK
ncbi:MAG: amino acid dehydrogenase [Defluviitaleaceae bacterium]|nr:amino acid dehydrogenase [Defluviitaleaceae bacterium]